MIARADVCIAFNDVQFEPGSWQQKNRIKGPQGEITLTVPVRTAGRRFQTIAEVDIDDNRPWAEKHWKSIVQNYRKAPYFNAYATPLERVYYSHLTVSGKLADFTIRLLWELCDMLQIQTPILRASDLGDLTPSREGHIIGLLEAVEATTLYDAAGAEAILDLNPFKEAGMTVQFQRYEHPEYSQLYPPFLPYMSALDVLFNLGPQARDVILSGAR